MENNMKNVEQNLILPRDLHRRLNRLIDIEKITGENEKPVSNETHEESDSGDSYEENITLLMTQPRERAMAQKPTNWLVEFCKQNQKDRVKWDSKLHQSKMRFGRKTMYEQAEDLIDIAASDFAEEINKLCDDESQHLSKEMIKKLFSIGVESDLSRSIQVNSIVRPAVHSQLALMFDCPQVSIEHCIRKLMAEDEKISKIGGKYHAFGRCLSPASKQYQADKIAKPEPFDFPLDIRSCKMLFHGIEHLRSTQALIRHLDEQNLPKPMYLLSTGAFDTHHKQNTSEYLPLHSIYQ